MLRLVLMFGLWANMAAAEQAMTSGPDFQAAQVCLDAGGDVETRCFGATLRVCIARAGDPAVIPTGCWDHEAVLWSGIAGMELERIIQEPDMTPAIWEIVHEGQLAALLAQDLECKLSVMSSPRTYDLMSGCLAQGEFDRVLVLRATRGADWSEY